MPDPTPTTAVSSSDRLTFTIFIALALHGLLIFGLTFESSEAQESAPTVTITLATNASSKAPTDADFLAQSNQEGSGSKTEVKEITTDVISPFNSSVINETLITEQKRIAVEQPDKQRIVTTTAAEAALSKTEAPEDIKGNDAGQDALEIDSVTAQIASLKAKLAQQRQAYARIPRERVLTSVSTLASSEAAYLNQWTEKIESIGNQYFPQEAVINKISGKLRLQVVIKHDGTIKEVNIKQSSGHSILDNAARQIVHRAAPFGTFPAEIRKDYEHIVIIRTWHFSVSGLTTEQ